jgi:hypothetical protein
MNAIRKPVKVNCWLITQDELDCIWQKTLKKDKHISVFKSKLHGANAWFMKERKNDYGKRKGRRMVVAQIETLEGRMILRGGDYLIKGVAGEFYPCRADIFKKIYQIIK